MYTPSSTAFLRPTRGGGFEFVECDNNAFHYPQTIGDTANEIEGLGPANEKMIDTIFIMPNKETDPTATMMIIVDEVDPSTDPKTYQYVYVGNINDLPSDVLTEGSIVNNLTTGGTDKPLSAEQGRTLNSHVNYTTCESGAADQVKLISDDGFELSTHLRLLVKMNNANTHAIPKFNINNTGIKDVWYNGSVASDINTWAAGEVLDVYYDGTKYIANTHGGAQFSTGEKVGDVGIDDEPTAGSNNLVKSGGIKDGLNQLNDVKMNKSYPIYETSPLTATDTQYQTNYYINYYGSIASTSNFGVLGFDCIENRKLLITGSFGSGQSCLGVFQDDNGNVKGLVCRKPNPSPYNQKVVSDYYCEVPSGATKIYVQTDKYLLQNPSCKLITNTTYRQYSEIILQNEIDVNNIQTDLEQFQSEFDETIYTEQTIPQTWVNQMVLSNPVVGETPNFTSNSDYKYCYIEGLKSGDVVNAHFRSGSSYAYGAKLKNGVIVATVIQNELTLDRTYVVDDSFDAIILNNYKGYVSTPLAELTTIASRLLVIENNITDLQETVNDNTSDLEQLQNEFDETIYTEQTIPQTWVNRQTYTLVVGEVPSPNTMSSYASVYIQNLKVGDRVFVKARSGNSWEFGAKVKNGIVVSLITSPSSTPIALAGMTFIVDDSFDAIVFNDYTDYVSTPLAELTTIASRFLVIENNITDLQETVNDIIEQGVGGEFNLLCFGNSFTQDTISYIPWLIKECEPNLKLNVYFTYMGGMPISQCLAYISNGTTIELNGSGNPSTKYENHGGWDRIYFYSNGEWVEPDPNATNYHKSYALYKYEDGANGWVSQSEPTAASVLQMKNWDLITIQQGGSINFGSWDYYFKPYVYQIQAELQKQVKHNFMLGYLMTHASYSSSSETLLSRYNGIVQNTTKMLENTPIEIILPYATALQNARTTYLDRFGAGGHLMGDTAHVSDGIGCLTCAYANTMAILDLIGSKKSIVGSQIYPDAAWLSSHNIPAVSSTIEGLSRYNIWLAQQCAAMATKYPLQLTNMVAKGMCGDTEIEIVNDAVYGSNPILSVNVGDSWNTVLSAPDGYTISNVVVMMGETDVTSTVYSSVTHAIDIANVSGKITITVTLVASA